MKIKAIVRTEPDKNQIASVQGDVIEEGDLTLIVTQAIEEARKQGIEPWGWSLSVEKA